MRVGKNGLRENGDEVIDDEEEKRAASIEATSVPRKLKATIKFGFDQTLSDELGGRTGFDSWISQVFTHTQAHFRHSESLGTEIEFEVCKLMKIFHHPLKTTYLLLVLKNYQIHSF